MLETSSEERLLLCFLELGGILGPRLSDLPMIIDCHGHYTTAPPQLGEYREAQKKPLKDDPLHQATKGDLNISDDQVRESLEGAQLSLQRARGTDVTLFSPRASWMLFEDNARQVFARPAQAHP